MMPASSTLPGGLQETKRLFTVSRQGLFFLVIPDITTGLCRLYYFKALQLGKGWQAVAVDKAGAALAILLAAAIRQEALTLKTASWPPPRAAGKAEL